jgi:NAD+ diphosphatase
MAVPGSSSVYWGGSIAYNTSRAKPFLLNDEKLHNSLVSYKQSNDTANKMSEAERYIQSKLDWTSKTALAFCNEVGTDYAIAEGGASGPTFRPQGLDRGFCVIAIAERTNGNDAKIVKQEIIHSPNANRIANMRLFADHAAKLALKVIENNAKIDLIHEEDDIPPVVEHHLDRATHLRSSEEIMEELANEAQYIVIYDNQTLFSKDWDLTRLNLNQIEELCEKTGSSPVATFLGMLDGVEAMFGVDLIGGNSDIIPSTATAISSGAEFGDVRTGAPLLSSIDNELVLHAMALAQWQRQAPYCTACGSPTILLEAGTCRECTNSSCGQKSWPRQDPSMIAVISSPDKERVLLGRSLRHPPKMYTALAGFVEVGESFEKAVAREVYEETGVRIDEDSVEYIGSQPWPFPQSIMIGFSATADDSQQLNVDENELVDAAWFDRDQVKAAAAVPGAVMRKEVAKAAMEKDPTLELLIPPKGVLARTLLDTWLDRRI